MQSTVSRRDFVLIAAATTAAYAWKPALAATSLSSTLLPLVEGALFDVARNRIAYQSSAADDDHTAHLVTDGSEETFWECAGTGEQWIIVELAETLPIERLSLRWGEQPAYQYHLEVSQQNETSAEWQSIHTSAANSATGGVNDGRQAVEQIRLKPTPVRRIRLTGTGADGRGFSLRSIQAWSAKHPAPPSTRKPSMTRKAVLLKEGWMLQCALFTTSAPASLSSPSDSGPGWLPAVVPATVLASYVAHAAVPDPFFGNQQTEVSEAFFTRNNFWYRNVFDISPECRGRHLWVVFEGINWKADVLFNGATLGSIAGSFLRSRFELTHTALLGATNCLAVLIHQVAHPGEIQHKQLRGQYRNGGILGLDSPTFLASIGWNWLPTIRGRNIGIWNDVRLETTGDVILSDPWVTSTLIANSKADLTVRGEIVNVSDSPQHCVLTLTLSGHRLTQQHAFLLQARETRSISVDKSAEPALTIADPQLWWPNGYGAATLHTMALELQCGAEVSDQKQVSFGIRSIEYQTEGGILSLVVNGCKVLCRGGNWGMDEGMLRCDAAGYDLRVRMHHDLHLVMIRNWIGMVGHDAFYEACDRYGILVWDDFWLANPGDGPDPADHAMFMNNVRDKIRRVRSHPCLALYCGRNEGDPPADLDAGMREATASLDGTRYYIPASASGLVTGHGPYDNQDPAWYFEHRGATFHSEQGIVCVPPIESMQAMMPGPDLWPVSDAWAVHDYQDPRSVLYTERIAKRYGQPADLADYCRKAQLVNLETAKAIYECLASRQGPGMLIWMTQAAWPALLCQLYDYGFEQTGAYFGAKAGAEPLHIFWDQFSHAIMVANNTARIERNLLVEAAIHSLAGKPVWQQTASLDMIQAATAKSCFSLDQAAHAAEIMGRLFFVKLRLLRGSDVISENFYWSADAAGGCHGLAQLPPVALVVRAQSHPRADMLSVTLQNGGDGVAFAVRLKVVDRGSGDRILPAMYQDNYVSLVPGEARTLTIRFPQTPFAPGGWQIVVDGWNVERSEHAITNLSS